jgi:hydrogenase maturation protease
MKTRIIGLGNTILSDDGVGVYAAREVRRVLDERDSADSADVVESEVGGFDLMELMTGWDRVILVDSIQFDGVAPGTLLELDPQDLRTSLRIRSVHDIDLPTVLKLGRLMGLQMPGQVWIYAIQAEDAHTLGETMTPAVRQAMARAVDMVLNRIGAS